jgi:hypothetical protein
MFSRQAVLTSIVLGNGWILLRAWLIQKHDPHPFSLLWHQLYCTYSLSKVHPTVMEVKQRSNHLRQGTMSHTTLHLQLQLQLQAHLTLAYLR